MVGEVELGATGTFTPGPDVKLVNAFTRPYENAIATARTCYSSQGLVTPDDVAGNPQQRDRLARSIYRAGHHTILQHAHLQFTLRNVSRQFIWTFLHSHPFYNSEQVSQRYVRVAEDAVTVPPLRDPARSVFIETVATQIAAYERLCRQLAPIVEAEYFDRFPERRQRRQTARDITRRTQEVARYVLPVATIAYLYHTVSALTLMRYWRLCQQYDAPLETRAVVEQMVAALLQLDPLYETILEEPLPLDETPEAQFFSAGAQFPPRRDQEAFRREFDASLEGHTSRMVGYKSDNESLLAHAVREVLGLPRAALPDDDAIALVLDPAQNRLFGESLNLSTTSKLTRALHHPGYTFRRKLSHTADSQDQRHRMTPASRPVLLAHLSDEPDYVTPALIRRDPAIEREYAEIMDRTWEGIRRLLRESVSREFAAYLLPNAVAIRFTESTDLLNLHHKHAMRLCYNAQEEIWKASRDEAIQVQGINPRIGRHLGAPCHLRFRAHVTPFCPEGDRYCGVRVWQLGVAEMRRVI
jgi:thymidylate synthase ThyX